MDNKFYKFDDDFLEVEKTNNKKENKYMKGIKMNKEYIIDLDSIDQNKFEGICDREFRDFKLYKEELGLEINNITLKQLYEDTKKNLVNCLDKNGKFLIK